MFKDKAATPIMIIISFALPFLYCPALAAETPEQYLRKNEAIRARFEKFTREQEQEIGHGSIRIHDRYYDLSLEEQEKIITMRQEREERWERLSTHQKTEIPESERIDLGTCISYQPFQECNI